jgi:uncharacterized membrane protein YphA (DoxX/SURF4 family)/thiol-disulfide isomerase/thioredoxin
MKTIFQNRWLIFTLRLVLGVLFIVASIAKIQDIAKFISTVASYGVLPDALARIYGYVAPWVELFIGFALIFGVFVRFSAVLSILLTISFMVASSYALVNAVGGSCGCFGKFLTLSHPVSLAIDVFMLFASLILLFNKRKGFINVGQLIERFHIKSRILSVAFCFAMVGLAVIVIGYIAIGVHNLSNQAEEVVETVSIPTSLANDVDNALIKKRPVLLEFYAEDCSACKEAEPIISDMEKEFINRTVFIRVDYYQNTQAVLDMGIRTTPTVLVIISKNSEGKYNVSSRFVGFVEREALQASLEKALESQ